MANVLEQLSGLIGDADARHMSAVWYEGGEDALRELIGDKRYKCAVEIGTFNAVSTCIIAEYADTVYTFDVERAKHTERVLAWAAENGRDIDSTVAPDDECFKAYALACEDVDLVFVDGDHWGDRPTRDVKAAMPCPRILVHDATDHFPDVQIAIQYAEANGYTVKRKNEFALLERAE